MSAQPKLSTPYPQSADPTPAAAQAAAAPCPALTPHALLEDLKGAAVPATQALLERMLTGAAAELQRMVAGSANAEDHRRAIDLGRALDLEQSRIYRCFSRELVRSFNPLGASQAGLDRVVRTPSEELDEQVRLTNLASKAKQQHREALAELNRRVEQAVRALGVPLSLQALAPGRICDAFRVAIEPLDADAPSRAALFELFDRGVVQQLGPVYSAAIEVLERHGIGSGAAANAVAVAPLQVDDATLRCLETVGSFQSLHSFADAVLAGELLVIARTGAGAAAAAVTQRLALVGQMFNEILADPHLPPPFAEHFATLRFPLIKAALSDPGFFTSPEHPLRSQLGATALAGLLARLTGGAGQRDMEFVFGELPSQSEIAASFVQPALRSLPMLEDGDVVRFLESQREQMAQRRDTLLLRVRRAVALELEVQTLGANVPLQAQALLRGGMGPLLAVALLRHGLNSAPWNAAMELLAQVVRSLEPALAGAGPLAQREALLAGLMTELTGVGLRQDRVRSMLDGLKAAYAASDRDARLAQQQAAPARLSAHEVTVLTAEFDGVPAMPPAQREASAASVGDDPCELLRAILLPERWFRVFDADSGTTRWLKVASYYPQHDSVGFTGFNRDKTLKLRGSRVLEDLAATRTEPIEPTREMSKALARLRATRLA
ncbi:MAG TPA: DUF1631 family protein [Solimonas sp.]|nr:DUF1631 family protein [Solimonas sp.]